MSTSWNKRRRNKETAIVMRTRRTLIRPPREWQMTAAPRPHPAIPVLAERVVLSKFAG